jgi:hypothetical protein
VTFERVDQKEGIRVHPNVRFSTVFGLRLALVDCVRGTRLLCLDDHAGFLVDLESWVERQDRGILLCIHRDPVQLESALRILDPPIERLELLALERAGVTRLVIFDDYAVFLGVGDTKPLVREGCNESSVRGEFLGLVKKRVQLTLNGISVWMRAVYKTPRLTLSHLHTRHDISIFILMNTSAEDSPINGGDSGIARRPTD